VREVGALLAGIIGILGMREIEIIGMGGDSRERWEHCWLG